MTGTFQPGYKKWLPFLLIAGAIFIAYARIIHAPFLMTWDDDEYVVLNNDIQSIDIANIKKWFSSYYVGNYAPITMFSYAINYFFSNLNTLSYHLTNIALHIFNAVLVYLLIKKIQRNTIVALFTSLLFALNPVQVEAVSWISERKTLLSAFFYLAALLAYAYYIVTPVYRQLSLVFLLGLLAVLCKPIAIVLPPAMFALDFWMGRNLNAKGPWLEKIPFFLVSIVFGLLAIRGEAHAHFLGLHPEYSGLKALPIAAETYTRYIVHLLAPVHLSVYYPFPERIGAPQYIYLVTALAVVALMFASWRNGWHILFGGLFFYSVNIALVLQFVQMSPFIMCDHYNYIGLIGITFPIVYYTVSWLQSRGRKSAIIVIFTSIALMLSCATFNYSGTWRSELDISKSLLDDYPGSSIAHVTTGVLSMNNGDLAQARIHFDKAVALDASNYKAWYNKGALELRTNSINEALASFNHCLNLSPFPPAYFSRALLYMQAGKLPEALADAEKALAAEPHNARAWYVKGYCMEHRAENNAAITCYDNAIKYEGSEALFYKRRGICLANSGNYQPALADLNKAVLLDSGNAEAFYYRGAVKYNLKADPCPDLRVAAAKGYKVTAELMLQLCK